MNARRGNISLDFLHKSPASRLHILDLLWLLLIYTEWTNEFSTINYAERKYLIAVLVIAITKLEARDVN